jgi:hypothetical protein
VNSHKALQRTSNVLTAYVGLLWAVPKSDVNIMTYSLNNLTLHLSINSLKPITDEHVLMATEFFVWKVLFARLYRQFSEFYCDLYTCSKVSLPTWQYTSCERKVGKVHVDDAVFVCMALYVTKKIWQSNLRTPMRFSYVLL